MSISRKKDAKTIKVSETVIAHEYPVLDKAIHGSVIEINGRYPKNGKVMNEKCYEIGFVLKGSGILNLEGEEISFKEGDQLLIKPRQRYFWNATATLYMPCAPAWYPKQHKEVD